MKLPEERFLGKKTDYPQQYAPEVLVAVPRIVNRSAYGIRNESLIFDGFDAWHGYEFSFLLDNGLPVVGILKMVYAATTPCLVESKSLKLYLNSFNMMQMGEDKKSAVDKVLATVKNDVSNLVEGRVEVSFFDPLIMAEPNDFAQFSIIEQDKNLVAKISVNAYAEQPDLLEESSSTGNSKFGSHLLRSNCKVTHQPDWGSVFVEMNGSLLPDENSFLKYVISLRNENHFHEEICEMIFKRLYDRFRPGDLMVACLYTRRGGIDINPVRFTPGYNYDYVLQYAHRLTQGIFRQ